MIDFNNLKSWADYLIKNPYFITLAISIVLILFYNNIRKFIEKLIRNLGEELKKIIRDNIEFIKEDISHIRLCTELYIDAEPVIKEFLKERKGNIKHKERKPVQDKSEKSSSGGNIEAGFE